MAGATIHSRTARPTIEDRPFHSQALRGTIHYSVALPHGYATSGRRYPVVYFLHGLPAGPSAYRSISGLADTLAANHLQAILVGAQGARPGDTDPEWHDRGPGRNWETATARELVRQIDSRYRTIARRAGRAIVGVSAGGYGAALIGIHHPAVCRVIESWSGYFVATDPGGKPLDIGPDADAHVALPALKRSFQRYPGTFFGFFIGSNDPYPGFVDDNRRLSRELAQAGVPHRFRIYTGAHNQAFWNRHDDEWLTAAVRRLEAPS
jgi:enterochelin esterase-like enzyme